jgi:hypothetical protein
MIDITVMPNSRPSDQIKSDVEKFNRSVKDLSKELNTAVKRDIKKVNDRIKQGVSQLEKVTRNNRWRI